MNKTSIRQLNVHHVTEALQVLSLQLTSYMIEADIIGFQDIPTLKDSPGTLQESGETFCGYFQNGELVGCIAYLREGATVIICRMMVHPEHFRKGIADSLLWYVEEKEKDATRFSVTAVTTNEPAVRLYEKHGYRKGSEREIAVGIMLAEYIKMTR